MVGCCKLHVGCLVLYLGGFPQEEIRREIGIIWAALMDLGPGQPQRLEVHVDIFFRLNAAGVRDGFNACHLYMWGDLLENLVL